MPSSRKKSARVDEATSKDGVGKDADQTKEEVTTTGRKQSKGEVAKEKTDSAYKETGHTVAKKQTVNVTSIDAVEETNGNVKRERSDSKASYRQESIADTLSEKFAEIDDLLKKSNETNTEENQTDENTAEGSDAAALVDSTTTTNETLSAASPSSSSTRRKKPFSCYNCVIFIMDAALLILSLLYPVLIKSRSKLILAEQTQDALNAASSGLPSRLYGASYAHSTPQSFFRHGSPWQHLLVEDIFDGDLATLKSHVSSADWTLVFYYASWDADSQEARKAFVAAAATAAASSSSGFAGVRFAACNCRWRHGSCQSRVTKIKSFPAVYAYDANYRGFVYQGAHVETGYLAFIDR